MHDDDRFSPHRHLPVPSGTLSLASVCALRSTAIARRECDAALAHRPSLIVLAGGQLDDDLAARWAYIIGRSVGPLPLAGYRRATQRPGATVLPTTPGEAQPRLKELADAAVPEPVFQLAG